jgi:hypothetical protein
MAQNGLPIVKSGYLFVYLSNETVGRDVFFDNLTIQRYHAYGLASTGPLVEETQLCIFQHDAVRVRKCHPATAGDYPFGLVIPQVTP